MNNHSVASWIVVSLILSTLVTSVVFLALRSAAASWLQFMVQTAQLVAN